MSILQMSFYGSVMILVIILLRTFLIHKLPKQVFLILWGVVLLRLLIPFQLPSEFSFYSLVAGEQAVQTQITPNAAATENETAAANTPLAQFAQQTLPAASGTAFSVRILPLLWCIGVLALLFWFSVSYLRCYMEFQTSLPVSHPFLTEWLASHPLKRRISIRQSDRIMAPLTYGMFRPVILLPKTIDWENAPQLQYVLQHEYIHICRFDTVQKLAAALALCLHWFNPFVWILFLQFNKDIELACDEQVIKSFGETSKAAYARTLISMEEKRQDLTPLYNSFSKTAIEERIKAIMKTKKTTLFAIFLSVILLIAVVVLFCTSAKDGDTKNKPNGSYAAMVKGCTEDTLILDFVEYVTDDDVERKAELIEQLNLEEGNDLDDGNFLNGYYIYDEDSVTTECRVAEDVAITLIDWEGRSGYIETSELYIFLDSIFSEYGWTTMPYFFEIEDGVITSIHEKLIP